MIAKTRNFLKEIKKEKDIMETVKRLRDASNLLKIFEEKPRTYRLEHEQYGKTAHALVEAEALCLRTLFMIGKYGDLLFDQRTQLIIVSNEEGYNLLTFKEILE